MGNHNGQIMVTTLISVKFPDGNGNDQRSNTTGPVLVETPAGHVLISYDPNMGQVIIVKGDAATTTIKLNSKALA